MAYKLSNKKRIDPIGSSCKKKTYYSHEEALDMIKYIKESRRVQEIHVYKCMDCGFWHLTSRSG
jgi:hypothetical protein